MRSLRSVGNSDLLEARISLVDGSQSLRRGTELGLEKLLSDIDNELESRIENGMLDKSFAETNGFSTSIIRL